MGLRVGSYSLLFESSLDDYAYFDSTHPPFNSILACLWLDVCTRFSPSFYAPGRVSPRTRALVEIITLTGSGLKALGSYHCRPSPNQPSREVHWKSAFNRRRYSFFCSPTKLPDCIYSSMSSSKSKPQRTISPLLYPPTQEHKTTIIVLHVRGSTAEKFAQPLLTHAVSLVDILPAEGSPLSTNTFHDYFPNTKFIFPTAPLRRAAISKRSLTHQWFDNWSLTEPEPKQYLQTQGLSERLHTRLTPRRDRNYRSQQCHTHGS